MASFFFLVVLKLLISLIRADRLTLRHLTESPLALCNDGTSATYHFTEEGLDNPNILIYLQGGGACVNNEDCENRCAQTDYCTANLMPTIEKETTFWSQTSQENPFRDYAKAYVHYCSSDLWSGTREASQETNGLNFYGKYIVDAVVTDIIKKKPNIENTTRVVLMGTSAGAFGVNLNCDFVADKFHEVNPGLDVRCISDSADFYPAWVHTENCDPYLQPAMLTEFWQSKRDVSCEEQSTAGSVECSMFTSYYNFIETPLMVVGRFIDTTVRGECTPELDQDPEFWKLWQEEVYSLALMFIGVTIFFKYLY